MSFETQSHYDNVAMDYRQNIRLIATECQSLFAKAVINNISISSFIRRAEQRFLLWASFLGVFVEEQQCLDIRLQNSAEMRNLILLMLQVLKRNLEHVIAEPYETPNDDKKGPVYGIDGALDRLHRLATIIRCDQTINRTQHAHRLNSQQVLDDFDETVTNFIQKHFPKAPSSLQLQLLRSVMRRTKHLVYLREQRKVPRKVNLSNKLSLLNLEAEAGSFDPLRTKAGESSVFLNKRATKSHNNTDHGASSIYLNASQGLNLYPDLPSLDGGEEEVFCEFCSAPLDKAIIESQEAWEKHVDHDLQPYVCISEECVENGLLFPTAADWRSHMEAAHSMDWPRYIHRLRWKCPHCSQTSVDGTFSSAEEFSRHLREGNTLSHCLSAGSFELKKLTVECKRYEPINEVECPLCKSYGELDGPNIRLESHDGVEDFYDHFIQHLRFVAFRAIELWDTQTFVKLNQHASADDGGHHVSQLAYVEDRSKQAKPLTDTNSSSSYLPDDTLTGLFRDEMDRASIRGVNGKEEVVPYVPLSALEKYWTDERVTEILKSQAIHIPQGVQFINQRYLKVFSTLVYSGFCDKISWFFRRDTSKVDDNDLPFDSSTFGHSSEWSNSFLDHQWMFCPVKPTDGHFHQQALDLRAILPVTYGEYIKEDRTGPGGAILRKVDFSFGFSPYGSMGEDVVFKIYEGDTGELRYNAETDAYIRLQKFSNDCITKCFASFHFPEAKKFVMVLEYAEGGSLEAYLKANTPPTTPEDLLLLWKPMFSLTEALDALTVVYQQNSRSPTFVGVHQEINPGNILVFPRGKGSSPFDVSFKLKDLGMAATGAMSVSYKMTRLVHGCNRGYVAPEVFNLAVKGTSSAAISRLADMWSLGALFSDFLVWTITGEIGRERYRVKRKMEILKANQFPTAGYDCCFHDGTKRLKVIEDVHNEVLESRKTKDSISPTISDLIVDYMLVEPLDRLDAMHVRNYAANKLKEYFETTLHVMSPTQGPADIDLPGPLYPHAQGIQANMQSLLHEPPIDGSVASGLRPIRLTPFTPVNQAKENTDPSPEKVTVERVYQLIMVKDSKPLGNKLFGARPSISDMIMDLPGMQRVRGLVSFPRRQIIILLDNCASMHVHREKTIKTARVISYVTKAAPDRMEVYVASETPAAPIKCKNSSEVEAVIRKFSTVQGECRVIKCLYDILSRIMTRDGFHPTSIYIFTDGAWGPYEDHIIKSAIDQAIGFLVEHRQPPRALMFQFVQFGYDPEGELRMRRLDNECAKKTRVGMYDIVNHNHWDSHVPIIVAGAIPVTDDIHSD